MSRNKHALHDLKDADIGESFAIMDSNIPLNDKGASLLRRIVIKEAEGSNDNSTVWKSMDERKDCIMDDINCTEDHRLRAEWGMCYCRPTL